MSDRLLTAEQVAEMLQLTPKTINALCREGKLAYVQVTPRERRFLSEQVTDFIRSRIIGPPKSVVDSKIPNRVLYPAKSIKGGKKETGESVRAQLREEMRSW